MLDSEEEPINGARLPPRAGGAKWALWCGQRRDGAMARALLEQPADRFVAVNALDCFAEEGGDAEDPRVGGHLVGPLRD